MARRRGPVIPDAILDEDNAERDCNSRRSGRRSGVEVPLLIEFRVALSAKEPAFFHSVSGPTDCTTSKIEARPKAIWNLQADAH